MDGFPTPTPELRQKWLLRANSAFERMFAGKSQAELVTLTQREDMAVLLAKELAAFLLEEHVARDPAVRPKQDSSPCCPKCGQAGQPAMKPGEALPERQLTTRAGDIRLERERWHCAKCRILFFSVRRSSASGDGRLQPEVGGESGSPGQQGGLVRRGQRRRA